MQTSLTSSAKPDKERHTQKNDPDHQCDIDQSAHRVRTAKSNKKQNQEDTADNNQQSCFPLSDYPAHGMFSPNNLPALHNRYDYDNEKNHQKNCQYAHLNLPRSF